MDATLATLAEYTNQQRAEAAATLREHGGEKEHFAAMQAAVKNLLGDDPKRQTKHRNKYFDYTGEDYPRKYRAVLYKYWAKLSEAEKLKIISLEAVVLKILAGYKYDLSENELRLSARCVAIDLYRQLGKPTSSASKAAEEKTATKEKKDVLLDTLFAEVERLRRNGYDFEQISGMMKAITKGRLKAPANKIADEFYKRHPEEKPQNRKAAPL